MAVALRLGLNLCVPHVCRCGSQVDAWGLHAMISFSAWCLIVVWYFLMLYNCRVVLLSCIISTVGCIAINILFYLILWFMSALQVNLAACQERCAQKDARINECEATIAARLAEIDAANAKIRHDEMLRRKLHNTILELKVGSAS